MSVHFYAKPPVSADDPAYQKAAAEEAAFWASAPILFMEAFLAAPTGPIKRYYNQRFTGDPRVPWYDTIAKHGPFQRGLVLGSGGMKQEERILATNPGAHLTFVDIDESGLTQRRDAWSARYGARFDTRVADLNFAELDLGAYDLIVSASTLHHVINLEHVSEQIARALTPDGTFILHDYTGPSGFHFPPEQKRTFEELYARERARRPGDTLPDIAWRDVDSGVYSPFEAVRPADTLAALAAHLTPVEIRGAGAVMSLLLFCGIADGWAGVEPKRPLREWVGRLMTRGSGERLVWERMLSAQCLDEITLLDEACCDAEVFPPNVTFGVYRHRG